LCGAPASAAAGRGADSDRAPPSHREDQKTHSSTSDQMLQSMSAENPEVEDPFVQNFHNLGRCVRPHDSPHEVDSREHGRKQQHHHRKQDHREKLHKQVRAKVTMAAHFRHTPVNNGGDPQQHQERQAPAAKSCADVLPDDDRGKRHEGEGHRQTIPCQSDVVGIEVIVRGAKADQDRPGEEHYVSVVESRERSGNGIFA
jgi:hypothetical protein